MKLNSPKLNYLIGFGAILLYIDIILVVVPLGEGNGNLATSLCITIPWFTAVGYSLCCGTMLVKMCRIWYIFNNPVRKKKPVSEGRERLVKWGEKPMGSRERVHILSTK